VEHRKALPLLLGVPQRDLEPRLTAFSGQRALRKRLSGVVTNTPGRLVLVRASRQLLEIELRRHGARLDRCLWRPDPPEIINLASFMEAALPSDIRTRLKVATLWNKDRVYLDSRGLLHLKSANRSIPETTLVLCHDGPMAAWCSDGKVCGSRFFLPDPDRSDEAGVFANIRTFLARWQW